MRTSTLLSLALVAAIPFAQKRASETKPADFASVLTSAQEAWKAERYGACMGELNKAIGLAMAQRTKVIVAALPAAPEGWTREIEDVGEQMRGNAFAAGLGAIAGTQLTAHYRSGDGSASLDVSVNADSPMIPMLNMVLSNPAMRDKGTELIEYGAHKALLTSSDGQPSQLQIVIAQKHYCQIDINGVGEDRLFKLFDQAAVDKLAEALSK